MYQTVSICCLENLCFRGLLVCLFVFPLPILILFLFFSLAFGTYFFKVGTVFKKKKKGLRDLGLHCKPVWEYILSCTAIGTEITKWTVVIEIMNLFSFPCSLFYVCCRTMIPRQLYCRWHREHLIFFSLKGFEKASTPNFCLIQKAIQQNTCKERQL